MSTEYTKKKYQDNETMKLISWWSTDDNVLCNNGKTLRENLSELKGIDLSQLTLSTEKISDGTKLNMTDGNITKSVTIPNVDITDEQLTNIIQKK